jgi:hypothetical protein
LGAVWLQERKPVAYFSEKLSGPVDEDFHTLDPSPPHKDNHAIAATKGSNDEIRIGPIT